MLVAPTLNVFHSLVRMIHVMRFCTLRQAVRVAVPTLLGWRSHHSSLKLGSMRANHSGLTPSVHGRKGWMLVTNGCWAIGMTATGAVRTQQSMERHAKNGQHSIHTGIPAHQTTHGLAVRVLGITTSAGTLMANQASGATQTVHGLDGISAIPRCSCAMSPSQATGVAIEAARIRREPERSASGGRLSLRIGTHGQ